MFLNNFLLVIKFVEVYKVKNMIMIIVDIMCKLVFGLLKCLVKNLGMVRELLVIFV